MTQTQHGSGPTHDAARRGGRGTDLRTVPISFWCFVGALLFNVFAGQSDKIGLPVPPDRLLFPAAIVLALLDPRVRRTPWRGVYTLMSLFVVVAACSALFADTLPRPDSAYALLDRVLMPFLLFACAPLFLATALQRLLLVRALTLMGAYLAVVAIAQTAGITALVFPSYIAAGATVNAGTETFRAGGPFLSGEANGMALAMCGCAAFLVAALDRAGWRILGLTVLAICLGASILTMTRSVWLSVAIGTILVLVLERRLWRRLPEILAVAVALTAVGIAMLPGLVDAVSQRGGTSRSLFDRANTNAAALRAIADHPVWGVGWGVFAHDGPNWVRQADAYPLTSVDIEIHNVVLSRVAELGLPAALLYLACLIGGPGAALLARRGGLGSSDPWHSAVSVIAVLWIVPSMTSPNPYTFPAFVAFTFTGYLFARDDMADDQTPQALDDRGDTDDVEGSGSVAAGRTAGSRAAAP
ncbi:MAG: O-antigen ligase family protein [Micrococcales bacterium]|nr:O-antigen ligase family protein [Micrococcales bacterium]